MSTHEPYISFLSPVQLADHRARQARLHRSLRGALVYPTVVVLGIGATLAGAAVLLLS